jgi:hypothetical protein
MTLHPKRLLVFLLLLAVAFTTHAQAPPATPSSWVGTWVGSWASSQQIPEPSNALPLESLHGATLRQVVHLSAGGSTIRVRVSNAFGTAALHLTAVHVARPLSPGTSRIDPSSDRAVTFNERADVLIPMGAEYLSDRSPIRWLRCTT